MEKSGDSWYRNSPTASSQRTSPSPNNASHNLNPNNPFRNPNALGSPPPPPYESHSSPFNSSNNTTFPRLGQESTQRFSDEKSGSPSSYGSNPYQGQQVHSYQPPQGPPPQQRPQFFPPPGPPQSNHYPDNSNPDYGPRNLNRDGDNNREHSQGPQGSYPQQQFQQQWSNGPQHQSSSGQYQPSTVLSGPSRGFVNPQHFDPNQPSANGSGGGVLTRLVGKNPLDPPPLQFSRLPPGNYPYLMFHPVACLSVSKKLDDGWPLLPPPAPAGCEHPFLSHDITEEDWFKFLKDMKHASSLTGKDRIISNGIPMVLGMSLVGGLLGSRIIEIRMKNKKTGLVGDLIDAWNNYFFHPRKMNVVLAQDEYRFSGTIDASPPDTTGGSHRGRSRSYSDSDSDSDRSGHDNRYGGSRGSGFLVAGSGHSRSHGRGPTRREARRERKEAKRERKANRKVGLLGIAGGGSQGSSRSGGGYGGSGADRHSNSFGNWRLVVCFWDGRREII